MCCNPCARRRAGAAAATTPAPHDHTSSRPRQMPATSSPEEKKRFVKRLARAFGTCTEESRQYGLCLQRYLEGIEKGACHAEFEALNRCFKAGLRKAK